MYTSSIGELGRCEARGRANSISLKLTETYSIDMGCGGGGSINIFYKTKNENAIISRGDTSVNSSASIKSYGGTGDFEIGKIENGIYYSLGL